MKPLLQQMLVETRRQFFRRSALGLGSAALASLMNSDVEATEVNFGKGLHELPHFEPKAKRAIYLFMAGAPSQMDLFDYKPTM